MKTSNYLSLLGAAAITMVLGTSCSQDSLTDTSVLPTSHVSEATAYVPQPVEIISWQQLDIVQPQCPLSSSGLNSDGEDDLEVKNDCLGSYGFDGEGQGYIEELSRFTIKSNLDFHPSHNVVTGLIKFSFPATGDVLVLSASGEAERVTDNQGGIALEVQVAYHSGTGAYEFADFEGILQIQEADVIFDTEREEYYATILIDGTLLNQF